MNTPRMMEYLLLAINENEALKFIEGCRWDAFLRCGSSHGVMDMDVIWTAGGWIMVDGGSGPLQLGSIRYCTYHMTWGGRWNRSPCPLSPWCLTLKPIWWMALLIRPFSSVTVTDSLRRGRGETFPACSERPAERTEDPDRGIRLEPKAGKGQNRQNAGFQEKVWVG